MRSLPQLSLLSNPPEPSRNWSGRVQRQQPWDYTIPAPLSRPRQLSKVGLGKRRCLRGADETSNIWALNATGKAAESGRTHSERPLGGGKVNNKEITEPLSLPRGISSSDELKSLHLSGTFAVPVRLLALLLNHVGQGGWVAWLKPKDVFVSLA